MRMSTSRQMGIVFWITGLSGSGKTTVARILRDRWQETGRALLLLDGEVLRTIFPDSPGFDRQDRVELGLSYGRLCQEIASQGIDVACSTISMFRPVYERNRANIPNFIEVYLRVTLDELIVRDSKGLYSHAAEGAAKNIVGIDLEPDEPDELDDMTLVIDNEGETTPKLAVEQIIDSARRLGCI